MGLNPPVTSRDFGRPDLTLRNLCKQCSIDPCSILILKGHAVSSSPQAIHRCLLDGALSAARPDLWPLWALPHRSRPWKVGWVNWNTESSRLTSWRKASYQVPPLAQMGKTWAPLTRICVNSEKKLNLPQRNSLTTMKTSPLKSKTL